MTEDYVRQVEWALRDLPWRQRRELIADLRAHLAELPEGSDRVARFGTPENYAAELRAAAGLEPRHGLRAYIRARRPRNLVLVTALVLAVALAITAVVYVQSYQPLANYPDAGPIVRGDAKQTPGVAGYTVFFRAGRPFWWGIPVVNNGPFAVRVLGAPPVAGAFFLAGRLFMSTRDDDLGGSTLEPFQPFDLQPGVFRWLVFKGVFACHGMGMDKGRGGTVASEFPVRFEFLWRTATADIPLEYQLETDFSKEACPAPKQ